MLLRGSTTRNVGAEHGSKVYGHLSILSGGLLGNHKDSIFFKDLFI